jgi:hypothetical protein
MFVRFGKVINFFRVASQVDAACVADVLEIAMTLEQVLNLEFPSS